MITKPKSDRTLPQMDRLVGMREAAAMLGVTRATLYGWIKREDNPFYRKLVKIGGRSGFRLSDIQRAIAGETALAA